MSEKLKFRALEVLNHLDVIIDPENNFLGDDIDKYITMIISSDDPDTSLMGWTLYNLIENLEVAEQYPSKTEICDLISSLE